MKSKGITFKLMNEKQAMEFLRDKTNWPRLAAGFVGLTAALVVIFVGLAMLIGH